MPSLNVANEIFRRAAAANSAIIEGDAVTTYADLDRRSAAVAARLGVVGGSRIARIGLRCRDGADYIALALGILRAGACFVPLAPEMTATERDGLVETLGLDFVLEAASDQEFELRPCAPSRKPDWEEALDAISPAFIRFSSGTTGKSKGVVLSHGTLRDRVEAANAGLAIGPSDRVLWVLSMSHHFAVSIILYLWHGATIVLPKSHLAGDLLESATQHGATVIYAAPFHYEMLAGDPTRWPSLRLAVCTTAALPPDTGAAFDRAFDIHPAQALGIIEVGLPCLNVPDPRSRPTSVGRAQPGFDIEIRHPDGRIVEAGEEGELLLRGPGMFDAYIEPWRDRAQALKDGWFATGDIARMDPDGFVFVVGRSGSAMNVGGMKFFPEEVEEVLLRHPGIADARVFSRSHPVFGMIPTAEIVATAADAPPSAREVQTFCRSHLARYKIPVEIVFVDKIARTASGKIKRA